MGSPLDFVSVDLECGPGLDISFSFLFVLKYPGSFRCLLSTGYALRFTGLVWGLSRVCWSGEEGVGKESNGAV